MAPSAGALVSRISLVCLVSLKTLATVQVLYTVPGTVPVCIYIYTTGIIN